MKKKIFQKSIIVALLASMCVAPFASCAPEGGASLPVGAGLNTTSSTESNEIKVPKYYEMPNDFRLVAYGTPPSLYVQKDDETGQWGDRQYDYNTQENWQILKDCGFTHAQPIYYETTEEDRILTLANAEAVNQANKNVEGYEPIKVLLSNYDNDEYSLAEEIKKGGTYAEALARIRSIEGELKDRYQGYIDTYPTAFGGVFGSDEPSAALFPAIAAAQDWFEWNFPEHEFYVNLLPEYASNEQFFGKSLCESNPAKYNSFDGTYTGRQAAFNLYLEMFCNEVTPYMVSYDHYCLQATDTIPGFLFNLASGAYYAKKLENKMEVEIPFFVYLQSMGFEGKRKIERYAQWAWQCYSSMAFGATGLQAFCYWTLLTEKGHGAIVEDGIITRTGEKTDLYYWVQQTNADIKAIEDVYMSYNWDKTMAKYNGTPSDSMTQLLASTADGKKLAADSLSTVSATITSDPSMIREFLIGEFSHREDSSKKAYMVTNSSEVHSTTAVDRAPAGQINLTFNDGTTYVDVYKPGLGGVAQRVALNGGVLSLTIPTGEGFFIVPVTE